MMKRLFEDDNAWSSLARRTANEVSIVLKDVLEKVECELGEPVDLRDFHFVVNNSLGGFVADLSIVRRMGSGDEKPREIIEMYPRLSPVYEDDELGEA